MANPFPQLTDFGAQRDKPVRSFFVFHVKRHAPEEIHINTLDARNEGEAQAIAERRYQDSTILKVRAEKQRPELEAEGYPSARFINGKFRAATFSDERLLHENTD